VSYAQTIKAFLAHVTAAGPTPLLQPSGVAAVMNSLSGGFKALWSCAAPGGGVAATD